MPTELVLLFHKKTTKLHFLWPNMRQKSIKELINLYKYMGNYYIKKIHRILLNPENYIGRYLILRNLYRVVEHHKKYIYALYSYRALENIILLHHTNQKISLNHLLWSEANYFVIIVLIKILITPYTGKAPKWNWIYLSMWC